MRVHYAVRFGSLMISMCGRTGAKSQDHSLVNCPHCIREIASRKKAAESNG